MCGLAGFNGVNPDINKLRLLGILNEERGRQATGISTNKHWTKSLDPFTKHVMRFKFSTAPEVMKFKKTNNIILTHNRRASTGVGKTLDKVHPFVVGDIILTHNGTLEDLHKFASINDLDYTYGDSDSELLTKVLDKNGLKAFAKYRGGAACAWHNIKSSTLNLWKGAHKNLNTDSNTIDERPMYYYYDEIDQGIYYCSMPESLDLIRNSEEEEIVDLDENTVYTFKNGILKTQTPLEHEYYEREYKKPKVYHRRGTSHIGFKSAGNDFSRTTIHGMTPSSDKELWIDGDTYMLGNKIIKNGSTRVYKGKVHKSKGDLIYFWAGYPLKDAQAFSKISSKLLLPTMIRNNHIDSVRELLHPSGIIRKGYDGLFYNDKGVIIGRHNLSIIGKVADFDDGRFKSLEPFKETLDLPVKNNKSTDTPLTLNAIFMKDYKALTAEIADLHKTTSESYDTLSVQNQKKANKLNLMDIVARLTDEQIAALDLYVNKEII